MRRDPKTGIVVLEDFVAHIRMRPEMYLIGEFAPSKIAGELAGQALAAGAAQVAIRRRGDWIVIESEFDWFAPHAAASVLRRHLPIPGVQNSMRLEPVITAFADAVVVAAHGRNEEALGVAEADIPLGLTGACPRALAFRHNPSPKPGRRTSPSTDPK